MTEEEYDLGALYAYGILINSAIPGLERNSYNKGENLTEKTASNFFLYNHPWLFNIAKYILGFTRNKRFAKIL